MRFVAAGGPVVVAGIDAADDAEDDADRVEDLGELDVPGRDGRGVGLVDVGLDPAEEAGMGGGKSATFRFERKSFFLLMGIIFVNAVKWGSQRLSHHFPVPQSQTAFCNERTNVPKSHQLERRDGDTDEDDVTDVQGHVRRLIDGRELQACAGDAG